MQSLCHVRAAPVRVAKPGPLPSAGAGAQVTEHRPGTVAWLPHLPDTYEIGLPNRDSRSSTRSLNERRDALAERAYAPCAWTWKRPCGGRRVPPVLAGDHLPPVASTSWRSTLGGARLHQRAQPHRSGRGPRAPPHRTLDHPLVMAGGHCAFNPERWPTSSTASSWRRRGGGGRGQRGAGGLRRRLRERTRPPEGGPGRSSWANSRKSTASTCRPCYEARYASGPTVEDGSVPTLVSTTPVRPGTPDGCTSGRSPTLAEWPYPRQQLVPLIEWSTTASTSSCSAGAPGAVGSVRPG